MVQDVQPRKDGKGLVGLQRHREGNGTVPTESCDSETLLSILKEWAFHEPLFSVIARRPTNAS